MGKGVRCTLIIFTLLAAIPRAPAVITHYVGTPVELRRTIAGGEAWYLDGAAENIELCNYQLRGVVGVRDPDNPDTTDTVTRESVLFPFQFDSSLRFIADDGNRRQVARLSAGATFDANAPLVQLNRFIDYPPVFSQFGTIVTFADGLWGNFEANAAASGYFAFRFDLNADGDDLTDQFQYGWARISLSEVVETDAPLGGARSRRAWKIRDMPVPKGQLRPKPGRVQQRRDGIAAAYPVWGARKGVSRAVHQPAQEGRA